MSIRILLNSQHPVYTNLDILSGSIVLSLPREEPFNNIIVKLECESKTRLSAPREDGRRQDVEFELHKLLYRTQTVFPTPQVLQAIASLRGATYILPAGEHRFPFDFKLPFNNACTQPNSMMLIGQDLNRHVKKSLPPSITGFPGEASIRYFVKVTASRSGIFRENYRQEVDLKFLPIEPPRLPPNRRESYARRQHQFSPAIEHRNSGTLFNRAPPPSGPPPRISIDGRLPDPPILTAHEPIPLRVLVKKLNSTPEIVFLKNFHLVLVGFTKIRARDLERTEQNTWVIASSANLQIPIGNSNTPIDADVEVDQSLWANIPLPGSTTPTFETCNLSRWYELRVEIGLSWGTAGNIKPELSVQSLRMPVDIYSGIIPPPELLSEMSRRPTITTPQNSSFISTPHNLTPNSNLNTPLQTPITQTQSQTQAQIPIHIPPHDPEGPIDDPPPSYEDAMAEVLPPVAGQRRDYDQPTNSDIPRPPNPRSRIKGERLFGDS